MTEALRGLIPESIWRRGFKSIMASVRHAFFSILTIYRRVVVSQKAKKILKRFSKEELILIGDEMVGPNHKENIFYDFLQGSLKMGNFFKSGKVSPFKKHITTAEYKEFQRLFKFLQDSIDTTFKKLPLLVNSPDIKKEAQAIYRARLTIGK